MCFIKLKKTSVAQLFQIGSSSVITLSFKDIFVFGPTCSAAQHRDNVCFCFDGDVKISRGLPRKNKMKGAGTVDAELIRGLMVARVRIEFSIRWCLES